MINKLLKGLLIFGMIFSLIGCGNKEKKVTIGELEDINNQISEYFTIKNGEYTNLAAHYVDDLENVVVVELVVNSIEQQEWFRENVIDSDLIKFVQGGPYSASNYEQ